MFELLKLLWDAIVLRDTAKKGMFSWRLYGMAFLVVLCEYIIALSVTVLYEKHPEFKSLFIATMAFLVIALIAFLWWGWRYQLRLAAQKGTPDSSRQL